MKWILLGIIYIIGYGISYHYLNKWEYYFGWQSSSMSDSYRGYEKYEEKSLWFTNILWPIIFPISVVFRVLSQQKCVISTCKRIVLWNKSILENILKIIRW